MACHTDSPVCHLQYQLTDLRRFFELCLLNANHITNCSLASWHITESRTASRHLYLFRWRTWFCVTDMQHMILDSTPYLSLKATHPSHPPNSKSPGIPWSRTLSLVHHIIDSNIPAVTLIHEMLQTRLYGCLEAMSFHSPSMTKLQRTQVIFQWDMAEIFTVASYGRVTRACFKCFLLSYPIPVTHRLSLHRNTLL